jgi:hypothetical protein
MRVFSVNEAVVFLNEIQPGYAPKSEETLRRAIRSGELVCDRNLGRDGNRIQEDDLLDYGKRYKERMLSRLSKKEEESDAASAEGSEVYLRDLLKKFAGASAQDQTAIKIELLEARMRWNEKRSGILSRLQALQNELSVCDSEIRALEGELAKR